MMLQRYTCKQKTEAQRSTRVVMGKSRLLRLALLSKRN